MHQELFSFLPGTYSRMDSSPAGLWLVFDGDHTKGLTELLKNHAAADEQIAAIGKPFIRKLLVRNADPKERKSSTKVMLLNAAKAKNTARVQANAGAVDIRPARSLLNCLHADAREFQDENEGSLAFRLDFGKFSYYTAGDLPSEIEATILQGIGVVHALKCGHHGSANSTPDELLQSARPLAAFISCGRNSFGHPTFDVIERLCAKTSPVQTAYLTNCIHNRRCVGTAVDGLGTGIKDQAAFEDQEIFILSSYFQIESMAGLQVEDFEHDKYVYDLDAIEEAIESCDPGKAKSEAQRLLLAQRLRVLRAMRRAAQHERRDDLKKGLIGRVAGNEDNLGTIVIHAPYVGEESLGPGIFHVGLLEDDVFLWYRHCRGKPPRRVDDQEDYEHEDALDDVYERLSKILVRAKPDPEELAEVFKRPLDFEALKRAILESIKNSQEEAPEWDYDLMEAPGTPSTYESHVLHRRDEYARFSVPTVVGLSARKDKTPYIPFCAVCSLDIESDDPDFELVAAQEKGEDDFVHFHRLCFERIFVVRDLNVERLDEDSDSYQEITHEDVYDLEEIVISGFDSGYNNSLDKAWPEYIRYRFQEAAKKVLRENCSDDVDYLRRVIAGMNLPEKDSDSGSDYDP